MTTRTWTNPPRAASESSPAGLSSGGQTDSNPPLAERAGELVSPGAGQCFDPGNGGRLMQEWVTLPVPSAGTRRRPVSETLIHRAGCAIFWLNVPTGIALLPVARSRLSESYGPATRLDLRY